MVKVDSGQKQHNTWTNSGIGQIEAYEIPALPFIDHEGKDWALNRYGLYLADNTLRSR